jgi:hypothetical protein
MPRPFIDDSRIVKGRIVKSSTKVDEKITPCPAFAPFRTSPATKKQIKKSWQSEKCRKLLQSTF